MIFCRLFVIFVMAMSIGSCQSSEQPSVANDLGDLRARVLNSEQWNESDTELLNDETFLRLYTNASSHRLELIEFLKSDEGDEQSKLVAILVAQGLPLSEYVEFSTTVLNLHHSGSISDKLLAYCIFPGASWGTTIVENASDKGVLDLLDQIGKATESELVQQRLKAVRDGSYLRYIDHLREQGTTIPVVKAKIEML